jgi:uridylate kinase
VYDADPRLVPGAKKYTDLTYQEVLEKKLGVMDQTAAALAGERGIEILVFDISQRGAMRRAVMGERVGTLVHAG